MDDVIDRNSGAFRGLLRSMDEAEDMVRGLMADIRPPVMGERYLTGGEACRTLRISSRTLQQYRDSRTIPYTTIGGRILYPESGLLGLLERNYVKARHDY